MNVKIARLAGFFGVSAPMLGFFMALTAISLSPRFSWYDNALSDLGVGEFEAVIFNSGLVMTGSLMMMFFLGPYELFRRSMIGRIGALLFLASAFFLIGIGVFNETFGKIHFYVSVGFFVSLIISLLIHGISFAVKRMIRFSILSLAVGIVGASVWLLPWKGAAIPEAVSTLAAGVWMSVLGIWMLGLKE